MFWSKIFAARRQPLGCAERLVFVTQSSLNFVSLYACLYVRTNGNQIENENLFGKKYVQRKLNSLPTTSRADALRSLAPYPKFDQFRNYLLIETQAALFCD